MVSFLKVCEDTSKKLGRQLQEDELKFLQWVYERYEQEERSVSSDR